MTRPPYELLPTPNGVLARIHARGSAVLASPTINRGTAFTLAERESLGLTGLLPTGVSTLEGQLRRVYAQYREQANDLRKWVYLANLRDRNEVLFYRLLTEHLSEMLPVVYTPTVGLAIERFSQEFRRTRGVYLSVDHPGDVETALRNTAAVREMAAHTARPTIMPPSNPTSKCEALPADLVEWTDGRVLTATGRPFDPVTYQKRTYQIAQADNALVFPGLGLGVAVAKARRISDGMIAAAADAVARMSDATTPGAALLPPMNDLRTVSAALAIAVAAAADEGLAQVPLSDPIQQIHDAMWRPVYPRIERHPG